MFGGQECATPQCVQHALDALIDRLTLGVHFHIGRERWLVTKATVCTAASSMWDDRCHGCECIQ